MAVLSALDSTWCHCNSLTRHFNSYCSNQWVRWYMGLALISDWLCCSFTSHSKFIVHIFIIFCSFFFLYFWPSGFKTVFIVNRSKTDCHKLRATCASIADVNFLSLIFRRCNRKIFSSYTVFGKYGTCCSPFNISFLTYTKYSGFYVSQLL